MLSNFAVAGGASFLVRVADDLVTSVAVAEEIQTGVEAGYDHLETVSDALGRRIPVVTVERDDTFRRLRERLDLGEATCLRGAARRGGIVATDDAAARDAAERRTIDVTGSVGLLAVGVRRDEISTETANQWLDRWQTERGYYAPVDRIESVLDD